MAAIVGEERYVFETDWYDQQAEIIRKYRITFYPGDSTIEMVNKSNFLQFIVRPQNSEGLFETVPILGCHFNG